MSDIGVINPDRSKLKKLKRSRRFKSFKFKCKYFLDILKKPFVELVYFICDIYNEFYENRKKIFKISVIIFVIYTLLLSVQALINKTSLTDVLINAGKGVLLFIVAKILYVIFEKLLGYQMRLFIEMKYSDKYVHSHLPKIAKLWGDTGTGKDSAMNYFATSLRKSFIQDIKIKMAAIEKLLFYVNFDEIVYAINYNVNKMKEKYPEDPHYYQHSIFAEVDDSKLLEVISDKFERNLKIIKGSHRKNYDFIEAKNDYENFIKEPRFYSSKFTYDFKINQKHCLEFITEYVYFYFRLNIDKHFIMSNQPRIESLKDKLMAKEFSTTYFKLIHKMKEYYQADGLKINENEKIIFGFVDYLVVTETEVDSFYNNLDKKINRELLESGTRDAIAYNRHIFGENFRYYQVGQNAARTASLMRELTHSFIYLQSRTIIDGGKIRNFFIRFITWPFKSMLNLSDFFLEYKRDKLQFKKENEIPYYQSLYSSSGLKKYKRKLDQLRKKEYPSRKSFFKACEKIVAWATRKIEHNKNCGWMQVKLSLSANAQSTAAGSDVSLKSILGGKITSKDYQVTLTFRRYDSHGLYDSYYLRALKSDLLKKADVNFYGCEIWSDKFKLEKSDALYMSYRNMDKFFGIEEKERKELFTKTKVSR